MGSKKSGFSWADEVEREEAEIGQAQILQQHESTQKSNPFGSARPREVVLQERGIDWRDFDNHLMHLQPSNLRIEKNHGKKIPPAVVSTDKKGQHNMLGSVFQLKSKQSEDSRNVNDRTLSPSDLNKQKQSTNLLVPPLCYPPKNALFLMEEMQRFQSSRRSSSRHQNLPHQRQFHKFELELEHATSPHKRKNFDGKEQVSKSWTIRTPAHRDQKLELEHNFRPLKRMNFDGKEQMLSRTARTPAPRARRIELELELPISPHKRTNFDGKEQTLSSRTVRTPAQRAHKLEMGLEHPISPCKRSNFCGKDQMPNSRTAKTLAHRDLELGLELEHPSKQKRMNFDGLTSRTVRTSALREENISRFHTKRLFSQRQISQCSSSPHELLLDQEDVASIHLRRKFVVHDQMRNHKRVEAAESLYFEEKENMQFGGGRNTGTKRRQKSSRHGLNMKN